MNHKINEFYPWSSDSKVDKQSFLCMDHSALINTHHSGEFLFTSLLLKLQQTYINNQAIKIVLLLTNHPRSHYETIFKKNHIDLKLMEQSKRIRIISLVAEDIHREIFVTAKGTDQTCWTWNELQTWQIEKGMCWSSLYPESITAIAPSSSSASHTGNSSEPDDDEEEPATNKFALLIDDLDSFEFLAPSVKDARTFMSKTYRNLYTPTTDLTTLLMFAPMPEQLSLQFGDMNRGVPGYDQVYTTGNPPAHADGQPKLSEYCRYRNNTTIIAQPLSTGYSTLVHGIITVYPPVHTEQGATSSSSAGGAGQQQNMMTNNSTKQERKKIVLQYKALDSGVTCSASSG